MYVVAVNRKAVIGYKKVYGRVEKILPGRRHFRLFGQKATGRNALISLGKNKYTTAVEDNVIEGDTIQLFAFPDRKIYSSFPEGDVCDVDVGMVPDGRFLVKDAKGARRAFLGKYGLMVLKMIVGAIAGLALGYGVSPIAGGAFFVGIAVQSLWAAISVGSVFRLYKTDARKLSFSGRNTA